MYNCVELGPTFRLGTLRSKPPSGSRFPEEKSSDLYIRTILAWPFRETPKQISTKVFKVQNYRCITF